MRAYFIFVVITVAALITSRFATAQTVSTWVGPDGVWSESANWSEGIPNGHFEAVIPDTDVMVSQDIPNLSIAKLEWLGQQSRIELLEDLTVNEACRWLDGHLTGAGEINLFGEIGLQNCRFDVTVNNFGTIELLSGAIDTPSGNGVLVNQAGGIVDVPIGLTFGSPGQPSSWLHNLEGGKLIRRAGGLSYFLWDILNEGLIEIEDNAQFLFVNGLNQTSTGVLFLNGEHSSVDLFGTSNVSGRIEGTGSMIGGLGVSGTLSPGLMKNAIGSLSLTGSMFMFPETVLEFDIGSEHDSLEISHNATLEGTLQLRRQPGLVPESTR